MIGHQNYERFDFNIPSGTLSRQMEEHGEIQVPFNAGPPNAKEKLLCQHSKQEDRSWVAWRSHLIDARIGNL